MEGGLQLAKTCQLRHQQPDGVAQVKDKRHSQRVARAINVLEHKLERAGRPFRKIICYVDTNVYHINLYQDIPTFGTNSPCLTRNKQIQGLGKNIPLNGFLVGKQPGQQVQKRGPQQQQLEPRQVEQRRWRHCALGRSSLHNRGKRRRRRKIVLAGAELAVDFGRFSEHEGPPEHVEQDEGGVQTQQGRARKGEACSRQVICSKTILPEGR